MGRALAFRNPARRRAAPSQGRRARRNGLAPATTAPTKREGRTTAEASVTAVPSAGRAVRPRRRATPIPAKAPAVSFPLAPATFCRTTAKPRVRRAASRANRTAVPVRSFPPRPRFPQISKPTLTPHGIPSDFCTPHPKSFRFWVERCAKVRRKISICRLFPNNKKRRFRLAGK